jgi:hypothetical protein
MPAYNIGLARPFPLAGMAGLVLSKNSFEKFKHLWFLNWKLLTFRHFTPSPKSLADNKNRHNQE